MEHPLDKVVTCLARRYGSVYFIECVDGRKAFVPAQALKDLVARLGDAVEVVEG